MTKESQSFKLKLKLPTILRSPFSRRGKKSTAVVGEGDPRASSSSYEVNISTTAPGLAVPSAQRSDTDDASSTCDSRTSVDANTNQQPTISTTSAGIQDVGSADGRSQSPAPSQARSQRQSMSKNTSGENFRVSLTVDTIKQQLNDSLQILTEFKKSLRPSSDVQRYDEAVGSLEGAAKGLATLKSKLSNRKLAGNPNRSSYVLPPPDLKLDFESDAPFGVGIPGIEESQKEKVLDVVQENKENEAQEEEKEKGQHQQQHVWV